MNGDDPHDPMRFWTPAREKKKPPGSFAFPAVIVLVALMTLIVAVGVIWAAVTGHL